MLNELDSSLRDSNDADGTRKRPLDDAYKEAISRIKSQTARQSDLALKVLSWITCAKRPLNSSDLQYAIAVEPGARTLDEDIIADIEVLVSICAGLVILDKESHVVRLAHHTTQEFFDRTWRDWFPDAHIKIARVCVTYLSLERFGILHGVLLDGGSLVKLKRSPLSLYATEFWGHHARNTAVEEDQTTLDFLQRVRQGSNYSRALRHCLDSKESRDGQVPETGLQVAAHFGLAKSMSKLLKLSPKTSSKASDHSSALGLALRVAVRRGWENVAELLLDQGARIAHSDMFCAATSDSTGLLRLLISKGPHDLLERWGLRSLRMAVGKGNQDMVTFLFDKGVRPDSSELNGLISSASMSGHEGVIRILLDAGADPKSAGENRLSPLQFAIKGRHEGTVDLLLKAGAGLKPAAENQLSLLQFAIKRGHEGIVNLLLEAGADPEPTLLSLAIQEKHEGIVKYLLERYNYDPKRLETSYLMEASQHGWHTVVELLLDRGLEIEAQDPDGWTALLWAVKEGHEKVVQSLIQKGADVRFCSKGETVYELALRYNNGFVLQLVDDRLSELRDVSSETDMEPSESELDLDEADQESDEEW